MFGRSARKRRVAKHDHAYEIHNVGADLQRQVCSICGQVSISASPPTSLRSAPADAGTDPDPTVTVVIDQDVQPVGLNWQFADRRSRR